jgi:3-oxoacyl-[acyl-carrier-protein] synthase II
MVLEEMLHALKRKATILGEITGYGNAFIPTHLTLPSVDNQILAIGASLDDAGTSAAEIDYVNAHATSTIAGDRVEASALRKIFGKRQVPVSALKSMTGHMLSASGAFEAACTAMSLCEGIIPPSINTRDIAPDCEIYLIKKPIQRPIKAAISNSFGFGGVNAVLTIRRFDPA